MTKGDLKQYFLASTLISASFWSDISSHSFKRKNSGSFKSLTFRYPFQKIQVPTMFSRQNRGLQSQPVRYVLLVDTGPKELPS